jgi:hypothetical protein
MAWRGPMANIAAMVKFIVRHVNKFDAAPQKFNQPRRRGGQIDNG